MDETNQLNIGIIILAAGASKRLGRPKQLLEFEGRTLLERITENALATDFKTVVVLGANAEKIKTSIKNFPVETIENENWQDGMSSSIVAGLKYLLEIRENLSAVIILLCDQPFIDKEIILKLIKTQETTNKKIIAGKYVETVGVPALFTKDVFDELLKLDRKKGAKLIIKNYAAQNEIATVSVPEAEFDIDTEADFERLKTR